MPLNDAQRESIARFIAQRTEDFLRKENLLDGQRVAFVGWPHPERLILAFHPDLKLPPDFERRLAAHLRRCVGTLQTEMIFLAQISYEPHTPIPDRVELDLAARPAGALMLPLGIGHRGPVWLSLLDMDSVLVGGTRRMGKTTLLHAWILSLVTGEPPTRVRLTLYDGKDGLEFGRYSGLRHVDGVARTGEELAVALGRLRGELAERSRLLRERGARSIAELPAGVRPPYLVLVVDELAAALEAPGVDEGLRDLVARGGAYGVLPVLATQRPENQVVAGFLKCNLATRIALPVPAVSDSQVILGRSGAEKLPKVPGRILFVWRGRLVEAQAPDVPTALLDEILGRLRRGDAPLPPPQVLEEWQRRLVETAMRPPFDGRFGPVRELAAAARVPRDRVDALARAWEAQGLLGPVEYAEGGRKLPRRILPPLLVLAGLSGPDLAGGGFGGFGPDLAAREAGEGGNGNGNGRN